MKNILTLIIIFTFMYLGATANHFINQKDTIVPEIPMANPDIDDEASFMIDEVYSNVEKMPVFKSCTTFEGQSAQEECTEEKLKEYISANLRYPVLAKERELEGTVIIKCRIDRNGKVFGARILKDIGDGCGKEALRLVNKMNTNGGTWRAGEKRGEKVLVELNIPVLFELDDKIFKVVETMPTLNDCKDFKNNLIEESCTKQLLMSYIYENFKYPAAAIDNNTEGKVVIEWTVSKTGQIIDIKALSKIGNGCEEEVIRVMNGMDKNGLKWNPATQKGKNVNFRYNTYINLTITKELRKQRKKELKQQGKS